MMVPTDADPRIPVTILTGFLGAGKTTLLNRILRENHGLRIAVIENEFGEAGIDNDLLLDSGEEQIVEMNNGCICCTVRQDLVRILNDLGERRRANTLTFDRVVIETTGLADPAPVAQTFFIDDDISQGYRLDAVITLVDARHGHAQLDEHHEAQEQVAFADRILVSKTDLVDDAARLSLEARLRRMNARAPMRPVDFGRTPMADLLDVRGFDLDTILELEPGFLSEDDHAHDEAIRSFVYRATQPFDQSALEDFLAGVAQNYGPRLFRYKGVLNVAGIGSRIVLQGVHMLMSTDLGRAWSADEPRGSTVVFIGRDLPEAEIRAGLDGCLART